MTVENPVGPCTLPYPDRYHAAVKFVAQSPKGAKILPDETKLILYALNQQASEGPCTQPKPWGWNIVENAKWQSWKQLGDLSSIEAMRLYVRALEDVEPHWWKLVQQATIESKAMPTASDKPPLWPPALAQAAIPASWATVVSESKQPTPRYDHAMTRIATQVYVVGGSCGGRYLGDVWVLDIEELNWRQVSCTMAPAATKPSSDDIESADTPVDTPAFEPLAGHKLVTWGTTVLCIGGHTKAKNPKAPVSVWALDTTNMAWTRLQISGEDAPVNRGSHTATLIGKRVYIFGGEDVLRRPLGDLWALDLDTLSWIKPETTGPAPRDRSAHVATVFRSRYLLLFGGGSLAHCFNDLHVLDTETLEWSKPETEGYTPTPRAGCSGALLTDRWFVMGGGDNTGGCTDMVVMDLKPLTSGAVLSWELAEQVDKSSPIACEGMGVVPVTTAALLLAFGGYNGKYHNSVHLYQPDGVSPETESTMASPAKAPSAAPGAAAAASNGIDKEQAAQSPTPAPHAASETLSKKGSSTQVAAGSSKSADLEAALAQAKESATKAEAAREAAMHEVALLKRQLASAQTTLAEAEKSTAGLRSQLEAESSKCFKLEVEVAELRKKLASMEELEKELEKYRLQAKEAEAAKGKGGLWGYISGAS